MIRIPFLVFISFLFLNCQAEILERREINEVQPYVVAVSAPNDNVIDSTVELQIEISQNVLEDSLSTEAIFLISKSNFDQYEVSEWRDLSDDIEDGDIDSVPIRLELESSQKSVKVILEENEFLAGEYVLVITPKVLSADFYPLNQQQAGFASEIFYEFYSTSEEEQLPSENQDADVPEGAILDEAQQEGSITSEEELENIEPLDLNRILITEVVTDPLQDFNESGFGNGVAFDSIPGLGTVGSTDEYIEIFNGTNESVSLLGWSLGMQDGTDEWHVFDGNHEELFFSQEGTLEAFQPGEFLVFGNPDGAINNQVTLTLLNADGEEIDSVFVEDANASDLENEAYSLDLDTASWQQDFATPGFQDGF